MLTQDSLVSKCSRSGLRCGWEARRLAKRILRHLLGQRPGAAPEGGRESARLGSHSGVCLGFSPLGRRGCGEGSVRSRTALGAQPRAPGRPSPAAPRGPGTRRPRGPHRTYLDLLAGCAVGRGLGTRRRGEASPRAASVAPHRPPPAEGPPPSPRCSPELLRRRSRLLHFRPTLCVAGKYSRRLPHHLLSPSSREWEAGPPSRACAETAAGGVSPPATAARTDKIPRERAAGTRMLAMGRIPSGGLSGSLSSLRSPGGLAPRLRGLRRESSEPAGSACRTHVFPKKRPLLPLSEWTVTGGCMVYEARNLYHLDGPCKEKEWNITLLLQILQKHKTVKTLLGPLPGPWK
nr:uncharacterized protein LOC115853295 [Globicephala melas]